MTLEYINQELQTLKEKKNYRSLPPLIHEGRDVLLNGQRMLNLSSNDYLGLANDISLREEFLRTLTPETFLPTSSSSRLLTGNFSDYQKLEQQLSTDAPSSHWSVHVTFQSQSMFHLPPLLRQLYGYSYATG